MKKDLLIWERYKSQILTSSIIKKCSSICFHLTLTKDCYCNLIGRLLLYSAANQFYIYKELAGRGRADLDGTYPPNLSSSSNTVHSTRFRFSQLLKFLCVHFPSYLCLCSSLIPDPNKWSKALLFPKLAQMSTSWSLLHLFSPNPKTYSHQFFIYTSLSTLYYD